MQFKLKGSKKGFTLVELLVVIAVLGIMAGIGLNSMSGITQIFKVRADERTCDQIARVLQVKIQSGEYEEALDYTQWFISPERHEYKTTAGEPLRYHIVLDELSVNLQSAYRPPSSPGWPLCVQVDRSSTDSDNYTFRFYAMGNDNQTVEFEYIKEMYIPIIR